MAGAGQAIWQWENAYGAGPAPAARRAGGRKIGKRETMLKRLRDTMKRAGHAGRWVLAGLWLLLTSCAPGPNPPTGPVVETTSGPGRPEALLSPPPTSPVTRLPAGSPPPTPRPPTPTATLSAPRDVGSATPARPAARWQLGAGPGVPGELRAAAEAVADSHPELFAWVGEAPADLNLTVGAGPPLATWYYAPVARFTTVRDQVTLDEVAAAWTAGRLLADSETRAAWNSVWGPAAAASPADLAAALWAGEDLGLVPFQQLTPDLKLLVVDGHSLFDPAQDLAIYPLARPVGVTGPPAGVEALASVWPGPTSNRDPERLTVMALTGVTALTRATAYQMEINGLLYPGGEVAPVLRAADIAHVSHEVAFAADCPYPDPVGGTTFCARDSYLALLQDLGVDVVELTGNHVNDWGPDALRHTLDLYAEAGIQTFGGGRDLAAARRPLELTHHGNRIAFVGCNPVGPAYAWAGADRPGSNPCDFAALATQIEALARSGAVVLATLQYWEFYHYAPTARQQADFQALARAGAHAVSGSQGHHAQGFDFLGSSFIHYGLGNLFFDQMDMLGTRQTLVDQYLIYDGRLLSVALWTGLIENYARPRQMTDAERRQLLTALFGTTRRLPPGS